MIVLLPNLRVLRWFYLDLGITWLAPLLSLVGDKLARVGINKGLVPGTSLFIPDLHGMGQDSSAVLLGEILECGGVLIIDALKCLLSSPDSDIKTDGCL